MKLSIIVPVYNVEKYIPATLDSLLAIRFSWDYEIVAVNDGSTDTCGQILADYQRKSDKIRVVTTDNQGPSGARDNGIRNAVGEYITFVDGDDTVDPDFFEKAVRELDRGGYDLVQGNFQEVYEDRVVPHIFVEEDMEITDRKQMLELMMTYKGKKVHYCAAGMVFRADTARRAEFDRSIKCAEDVKYTFDVLCAADRIKLLKDMSIHYIQRSTSNIHTPSTDKVFSKLAVWEYMIENNPYPELNPLVQWYRIHTLFELCYRLCVERDAKRAREVQKQLLKSPYKLLWSELDRQMRKRILLHKYAGPLYILYLLTRSKR